MKVVILGSGIIGTTTAYFLGARGFEVEVIERKPESGTETSFATGGQLSFSHAEPWANPAVLPKALKWMFEKDAPLVLRPRADWGMITWGLRFLANCTEARARNNGLNILRLGLYSKKKLDQLRSMTGIKFDHSSDGILQIFTQPADFERGIAQAEFQAKFGCKEDVLTADQCRTMEPALEHLGRKLVGGIHAPLDECGDTVKFTQELATICTREFGTVFRYDTEISKLEKEKSLITGVMTDKGMVKGDCYVMALGSYSPIYLRKLGISVPIYPMKGYSITFPANNYAPHASITDIERKIVYTRLGNRVRVAGTAEFAGYNTQITPSRIAGIMRNIKEFFPKIYTEEGVSEWACLRPSTPDGPPIIGKTPVGNLYLNTGHGTLGWTQAAGSAALLADIMENRSTEIGMTGLNLDRYL